MSNNVETQQEESVIRDVLEELDKERTKRAELESEVRKLSKQLSSHEAKDGEGRAVTRQAVVAMEAQVRGYQQLVDALTAGKPAIDAAAAAESSTSSRERIKTLPLHVVRLLEIMPWDPRANEHIFGTETVIEWQVYVEAKWNSQLRYFPTRFKSLPILKPDEIMKEYDSKDRNLLLFLAKGSDKREPSKHGVLTDEWLTKLFNIEKGYPLPQDGGNWEWIGGWRIDKRHVHDGHKIECDESGWSYAEDPSHFIEGTASQAWSEFSEARRFRRRKWTRRRVLIDFPYASERTKAYLKLLAENARYSITVSKLSDQLVETKMALTDTEDKFMQLKSQHAVEIQKLQLSLEEKGEMLQSVGFDVGLGSPKESEVGKGKLSEFLSKNEQVKEFGSKISHWVQSARKMSEDTSNLEGEEDPPGSASQSDAQNRFDWKSIGRGAILNKIKPQASSGKKMPKTRSELAAVESNSTLDSNESCNDAKDSVAVCEEPGITKNPS